MSRTIRACTFNVAAAAIVCSALALASPAAAKVFNQHIATDCPTTNTQGCPARPGFSVTTPGGPIRITFRTDDPPAMCSTIVAQIWLDDIPGESSPMIPGQNLDWTMVPTPGTHQVGVQASGLMGGCNTGSISGWSGQLRVETIDNFHVPLEVN
jgi:hypothetical protein